MEWNVRTLLLGESKGHTLTVLMCSGILFSKELFFARRVYTGANVDPFFEWMHQVNAGCVDEVSDIFIVTSFSVPYGPMNILNICFLFNFSVVITEIERCIPHWVVDL